MNIWHLKRAAPLVAAVLLCTEAVARPGSGECLPRFALSGLYDYETFGYAVAGGGDIDGDSVPDFVVGAPTSDRGSENVGRVYFYSGADGSLFRIIAGQPVSGSLGYTQGYFFGHAVAIPGDVNGDGRGDLLVGAPGDVAGGESPGEVLLHSGKDASLLYRISGTTPGGRFGFALDVMEDVDGDKVPDFIVGAPGPYYPPADFRGRVCVHSGADGSLLHTIDGPASGDRFGWSVATAAGPSGPMIIAGAPATSLNPPAVGRAYVFDVGSAEPRLVITGEQEEYLGWDVAGLGDLNGDAVGEFAVGRPGYAPAPFEYNGRLCSWAPR